MSTNVQAAGGPGREYSAQRPYMRAQGLYGRVRGVHWDCSSLPIG